MIHVIEGPDAFLRRQQVESLIASEKNADVSVFDGADCVLAAVLDEARTLSFIGARVCHVRNAAELVNDNAEVLVDVDPSTMTLVLEAEKFDRRRKGMKALMKRVTFVQCDPPEGEGQLLAFVRARARVHQVSFDRGADYTLVERLGGHGIGCEALDAEIAKFGCSTVSKADVGKLVAAFTALDSFTLIDAINGGRRGDALETLAAIYRDGMVAYGKRERDPMAITLMLLGAIRWDLGRTGRSCRMNAEARARLQAAYGLLRRTDSAVKHGAEPHGAMVIAVGRLAQPNPAKARR